MSTIANQLIFHELNLIMFEKSQRKEHGTFILPTVTLMT